MLKLNYDGHCAYKPAELGLQIAQLLTDKVILPTFKFHSFFDRVVKNEDGTIDDTKHACILVMVDDKDNKITDLKPMNCVAAFLIQSEDLARECGEDEGLAMVADDNCGKHQLSGDKADNRIRVMSLDYTKFKERLRQSREFMSDVDRFGYDEVQKCYFSVADINEHGLDQFKENGLDYVAVFEEEESRCACAFLQKHFPDEWKEMSMTMMVVDLCRKRYDEADKTWRHRWKFCFTVMRKDPSMVEGDHAVTRIHRFDVHDPLTDKDISSILNYYLDAGMLMPSDLVLLISPSKGNFMYIRSEDEVSETVCEKLKKCTVENVMGNLSESDNTAVDCAFIDGFELFLKDHSQDLVGKTHVLSFVPEQLSKL